MYILKTMPPAAAPLFIREIMRGVTFDTNEACRINKFKNIIKNIFEPNFCFTVSSGKSALAITLKALKILSPYRFNVVVPDYGCFSIVSAIDKSGLKLMTCEVNADLDLSIVELERLCSKNEVLCVISPHFYGAPANIEAVKKILSRYGVYLIEDAAQAMGGIWQSRKLGTVGDAGVFSLGRGKALTTVEGGVILTKNKAIAAMVEQKVQTLSAPSLIKTSQLIIYALGISWFLSPYIYWLPNALTFLKLGKTHYLPEFPVELLSSFQAGMAHNWPLKLSFLKGQREVKLAEFKKFGIKSFLDFGPPIQWIRLPVFETTSGARDTILKHGYRLGLGISNGYPAPMVAHKLREVPDGQPQCNAEWICKCIMTLPVHKFIKPVDMLRVLNLHKYL